MIRSRGAHAAACRDRHADGLATAADTHIHLRHDASPLAKDAHRVTHDQSVEALLDIVDKDRTATEANSAQLVVLGLAVRHPKRGYSPTNAGWNVMGQRGRAFDTGQNPGRG